MSDNKLWREEGLKALLEFLSNATGEDHDAAVYDTKLEFDSSNMDAVRYIASAAMTKASQKEEVFECRMPEDGSVCPYDEEPVLEVMRGFRRERLDRESKGGSVGLYIPDSSMYSEAVIHAVERRNVMFADMTDEDKQEFEERTKAIQRSDRIYMFWHCYFPTAFAIFSFIYIVYRLSH